MLNETNDELLTLLRADQFKNDIIFAHIEVRHVMLLIDHYLFEATVDTEISNTINSEASPTVRPCYANFKSLLFVDTDIFA